MSAFDPDTEQWVRNGVARVRRKPKDPNKKPREPKPYEKPWALEHEPTPEDRRAIAAWQISGRQRGSPPARTRAAIDAFIGERIANRFFRAPMNLAADLKHLWPKVTPEQVAEYIATPKRGGLSPKKARSP